MISVIIIDFNTIQKTINYIKKFYKEVYNPEKYHFIIVDNYIKNDFSKLEEYDILKNATLIGTIEDNLVYQIVLSIGVILYCKATDNLGFAKGNNLGVKISNYFYKDSYYIFSNNDLIFVEKLDVERWIEFFEKNPNVGIIGPHVVDLHGKEQSPCKEISVIKQLIFNYWGYILPFYNVKGDIDYDKKSKKCYWVSGCFFITKAEVFNLVEGFDNETFLYAEEMILSERYKKLGYEVFFDNDYTIIHESGATVKKNNTPLDIMEVRFKSLCYYQRTYRKASKYILSLAKINFAFYKVATQTKNLIKGIIKK